MIDGSNYWLIQTSPKKDSNLPPQSFRYKKAAQKIISQIGHDHINAENVTWCEGSGCFSLNIKYDVPLEQVVSNKR